MTDSPSLTRRIAGAFIEAIKAALPGLFFYGLVLWVYAEDGFELAIIIGLAFIFMEVYDD